MRGDPNRRWRPGRAMLVALAYPALRCAAWLLGRASPAGAGVAVYQSYQVGDLFMAMPALRRLAAAMPVTVLCRPDCLFLLREAGIPALPLACPFFFHTGPRALWTSLRNAWALRGRLPAAALDFEADPRSAFFLKVAGARRTFSYARPFGWLFDRTAPLPAGRLHQSGKNLAVAEAFLRDAGLAVPEAAVPPPDAPGARAGLLHGGAPSLILSCWTRRDEKNWPLDHWGVLLEFLAGRPGKTAVLVPPDGGADFARFREKWRGRVEFLATDLAGVFRRVREADGIVCTDNFLGHMGAYLGKPVLWINGSSDPGHVSPQGRVRVVQVDPMPCRPCQHRCHNPVYKQCLIGLGPDAVIRAARDWLDAA